MSTAQISKVYKCLNFIQFLLLPGTCILCQQSTGSHQDICRPCLATLPVILRPCLSCGLPLPPGELTEEICGACICTPPPCRFTVSAYTYSAPINHLVSDFKYYAKLHVGRVLANQLLLSLKQFYQHRTLPELIIPVPLHQSKLRHRGFNQAHELAKYLAKNLDM